MTSRQPVRLLTKGEFDATFTTAMKELPPGSRPFLDVSDYLDALLRAEPNEWGGIEMDSLPRLIYRSYGGRYEHLLFPTDAPGLLLVVIVILKESRVYGHRRMD